MSTPLWTGTARSRWAVPVALLMLVTAVGVAVTPVWHVGILVALSAGVVLAFRRITVTVDRKEVVVRYGVPWTWPQRIARTEIRSAAVIDLRPWRWGGWGYRGSLRVFGRAAIVLRGGEAIELVLRGRRADRRLAVTVDDAVGAVAALES